VTAPDLTRPQVLVDDLLIEEAQRLGRRVHQPQKLPNPVLQPDKPWEGNAVLLWGTVIRDERDGFFRMWYQTFVKLPPPEGIYVCYAVSSDGIGWEKPVVGDVEYRGSRQNNIVVSTEARLDSPSVVVDPEDADESRRYKMLFYEKGADRPWGLYAAFSPDGVHWHRYPDPVAPNVGDRTNVMRDEAAGLFVAYTRKREMMSRYLGRCIYRAESSDFIHWSEPEFIMHPDLSDGGDAQFYSMAAFPYHDSYLGAIEVLHSEEDALDIQLACSRDNRHWRRVEPRQTFLPRGPAQSWHSAWVNISANPPILFNGQLLFFFTGRNSAHGQRWPHPYAAIGLASMRPGRILSIEAGGIEGRLLTKPLTWPGGKLEINADTSISPHIGLGEIRVEVCDAQANAIAGLGREDCLPFHGDAEAHVVTWKGDRDIAQLAGEKVRLAFWLRQARLYWFRAAPG
jgi:hypothetical protein